MPAQSWLWAVFMLGSSRYASQVKKWAAVSTWTACTLAPCKPTQNAQADSSYQLQQILANPTPYGFVEILKSCTNTIAVEQGNLIYFAIVEGSFDANLFINNTLITLYVKYACLDDAQCVFDRMPQRDAVTWNAIMSGHSKLGQDWMVFHLFWRMQIEGLQRDNFTYVSILKACWSTESLGQGKVVHTLILAGHFEDDIYIGSALVHMYAICCSLETACKEFENLQNRNVVTWNAMITGYIKDGQNKKALSIFQQMQHRKIQPNDVTFICVLKASSRIEFLPYGMLAHAFIIECNFELNVMIGTTLLDMYAKCECLKDAEEVFKRLPKASVVTWSAMLAGYVDHGCNIEALSLFEKMQNHGVVSNNFMHMSLLKACSQLSVMHHGKLIHALIIESGHELEEFIGNALISMHMICGSLVDACSVFDKVPNRTVVTWSAMIEGYAELGYGEQALALFQQMLQQCVKPNNITFLSVLKACSSLQALNEGKLLHIHVNENGFTEDLAVGNTLIDMYAKCGSITGALMVFNELPKQSVSTWNAVISGYVHHGDGWEALRFFQSMQAEGTEPNNVTFISILKACCCISALQEGKLIHTTVLYCNVEMDVVLQSALIDFYAKHGCLEDAQKQYDDSVKQDLVPCNAMMTGYAQHGRFQETVELFLQMQKEEIKPDIVTFLALLQGCSMTTALVQGKLIHDYVMQSAYSSSLSIGNALIDMYAKCGSVPDACQVFDNLTNRDVISWTTMIAGHARGGDIKIASQCFIKMQEEGFKPNDATFVSLLSACSHMGQVKQAISHIEAMRREHGILPADDHCNTIVDALGRLGHLMEAEDLMQTIPYVFNTVGWASLLCHCNTHVNAKLGKGSFNHFVSLDSRHASGYTQMAVLLMHAKISGDANKIEVSSIS